MSMSYTYDSEAAAGLMEIGVLATVIEEEIDDLEAEESQGYAERALAAAMQGSEDQRADRLLLRLSQRRGWRRLRDAHIRRKAHLRRNAMADELARASVSLSELAVCG